MSGVPSLNEKRSPSVPGHGASNARSSAGVEASSTIPVVAVAMPSKKELRQSVFVNKSKRDSERKNQHTWIEGSKHGEETINKN
jgi:hypothetical protein